MRKHLFGPFLLQKQQMESVFPGDETCCSSVIQDGSLLNIQLNKLVLFCFPPPQEIQFKRMPSLPTRRIRYLFHRTVNTEAQTDEDQRIVYIWTKGTEFREISPDTQRYMSTIIYKCLWSFTERFLKWHSKFTFFYTVTHMAAQCLLKHSLPKFFTFSAA